MQNVQGCRAQQGDVIEFRESRATFDGRLFKRLAYQNFMHANTEIRTWEIDIQKTSRLYKQTIQGRTRRNYDDYMLQPSKFQVWKSRLNFERIVLQAKRPNFIKLKQNNYKITIPPEQCLNKLFGTTKINLEVGGVQRTPRKFCGRSKHCFEHR